MSDYRGRSGRSGRGSYYRPGASSPQRYMYQAESANKPIWFLIIMDILVLGLALNLFAFSRRMNNDLDSGGVTLPPRKTAAVATPSPAQSLAPTSAGTETSPAGSETPQATQQPADLGMWGGQFADKFTSGDVEKTGNTYKSRDINIKIDKVQENGITYFLADIYVRNLENLKAGLANGKPLQMNQGEMTDKQAQRYNAIVAINGDNYGDHQTGVVIRNGEFGRDKAFKDVCVLYNDGTMKTFSSRDFNLDQEKNANGGIWQAWGFGPMLLDQNGGAMTKFDTDVNGANPRSAIGYYEPGHYCFLLVDGRQANYSKGMTTAQMSSLFASLGCKAAYNLDGGRTSVMAFMGQVYNQPYEGGRSSSDIIYIGETR